MSALPAVGFEAAAVSAKHARVQIGAVPAPTSAPCCDIRACREKQEKKKQHDRGHWAPPLVSQHVAETTLVVLVWSDRRVDYATTQPERSHGPLAVEEELTECC